MIALGSAGTSVQELWQVCLQNFDVEPDRANNMFGGIRPQQLVWKGCLIFQGYAPYCGNEKPIYSILAWKPGTHFYFY